MVMEYKGHPVRTGPNFPPKYRVYGYQKRKIFLYISKIPTDLKSSAPKKGIS
jgi:hypothetical protein